jgi:NIPSNAP
MPASSRLFELRTYHAVPGRLDALVDRFRDYTMELFDKHGIGVVGFWMPVESAEAEKETLVYMLAFDDRQAADRAWAAFRVDPAWAEAKAKTEQDGPLTVAIDSVFLTALDFSPLS